MSTAFVTAGPLSHLRWGEAPRAAVLLHGIGGGREAWGDALSGTGAALAAAGWRALAVDLPGYGASAAEPDLTIDAMARRVLALVAAQRAGGVSTVVLVGHSMGGMVAQAALALQPAAAQALVLASTSPAFGKADGAWQQQFIAQRTAPLDAGLGMAGMAARLVPSMVAPGVPADRTAGAQGLMAGVPEATYRAALQALLGFDRRADLPSIRVPTLVVTGEHDATAPPEVARRMAERIPGARCEVLPGAGHLLNMEQPAAFNAALLAFLSDARVAVE